MGLISHHSNWQTRIKTALSTAASKVTTANSNRKMIS